MDTIGTPTWLAEPCPTWCTRQHDERDHPDDRVHESDGLVLPIACGPTPLTERDAGSGSEVVTLLRRPVGSPSTWVAMEETEGRRIRVTMSRESATALARMLAQVAEPA